VEEKVGGVKTFKGPQKKRRYRNLAQLATIYPEPTHPRTILSATPQLGEQE